MDYNYFKKIYKIVLFDVFLLFVVGGLIAQEKAEGKSGTNNDSYIQWVSEFPVPQSDKSKINLFKKVGQFLFKKEVTTQQI